MDFELSEEQKMFQTAVRDFVSKEVEPGAARRDDESCFPREIIHKLGQLGILGVGIPEKYGGSGGDYIQQVMLAEEVCRAEAGLGTSMLASVSLCGYPIYKFASDELKRKYVPGLAQGTKVGCFGLTEQGAGSDAAAIQTSAVMQGDSYVLNGSKIFITNGGEADISIVFASFDQKLHHKGIVALIVDADTPGFSVGKKERKMGIKCSSTAELIFENCRVPADRVVGEPGRGFNVAMDAIDSSRVVVAAQAVGIAQGALDAAVKFSTDREQFGQRISNFQAIQWMLADMATHVEAGRLLTYQAAYLKGRGKPFVKQAAMAKLFAAEAASTVASKSVQIHGGYGYIKDYPVERYFRDAKITEIYEGTSEMQRMTIARHLVGV